MAKSIEKVQKHLFKTKFYVHPLTILLVVLSCFVNLFWLAVIYFASLVFHECAHAMVAKRLGYKADKIVIYPTGALLFGETDEFYFKDEILVSIAGPLANLFVVVLLVFNWWIFPEIYNYSGDIVVANLSLALFNMLPVYPMDGGRVLLAMLARTRSRKEACKIAKLVSICFSLVLFFVFVVSIFYDANFQIAIMSIVMFVSSMSEDKQLVYKRFSKTDIKRRRLNHGLKKVVLAFSQTTPLSRVLSKIDNFGYYEIEVYDDNFNKVAILTENQIEIFALRFGLTARLKEICSTNI